MFFPYIHRVFSPNQQYNATAIFCFTKSYFNKNLPGYRFITIIRRHPYSRILGCKKFIANYFYNSFKRISVVYAKRSFIGREARPNPNAMTTKIFTRGSPKQTSLQSHGERHHGLPRHLLGAIFISCPFQSLYPKYTPHF